MYKNNTPHCENMIKKLFTLSAVKAAILLLLVFSYQQVSGAQTISIGTVRIDATKDNADVLGNGTVSYEAANLFLKLKGASIEGSIVINGVKDLTLQVEGENSVVSTKAALEVTNNSQVTVTGDRLSLTSSKNSAAMVDMQCKLTLKEVSVVATGSFAALAGSTGFMGEVLEIDNTNLTAQGTAYAIGDLQIFSATNVKVIEPADGAWNPANSRYCDGNQKVATKVVFKADKQNVQPQPLIRIGEEELNLKISNDDILGDGKLTYSSKTKEITFNEYSGNLPIKVERAQGYSFVFKGNNYIETPAETFAIDQSSDITLKGEGELTLVSKEATAVSIGELSKLLVSDLKLSVKGKKGISGVDSKKGEALVVDSAAVTIMAEDYALANVSSFSLLHARIVKPVEAYWNYDTHQLVDVEGHPVTHLVIETKSDNEGKNLGMLAIGSTYLDLNKTYRDILGDGKVSYDAERHTLTLDNAAISFEQNALYMQEANDLIIKVVGDCQITSSKKAAIMMFYDSKLTITGPGKLTINSPENCGIYLLYRNDLLIKEADVTINGRWAIAGLNGSSGEKVELDNTRLSAKGWESGISSLEEITLTQTKLSSPENAVWDKQERCYMVGKERVKELLFLPEKPANSNESIGGELLPKILLDGDKMIIQGEPNVSVALYNMEGRMMLCHTMTNRGVCEVQTEGLQAGVYLIQIGSRSVKILLK